MSTLKKMILHSASQLPPFPKVSQKVLELLEDPDVSTETLVDVVQMDPSLTAEVLKAVNSPIYGVLQKVDNLSLGLSLLGNKTFSEVVFTSSSAKLLSGNQDGYDLENGDLWKHSLATAIMTRIICDHLNITAGPNLYTAALLHDIGKVILSRFVENQFIKITEKIDSGVHFLEAEKQILGMDHAELGGYMSKEWGLSDEMTDLIRYHHTPEKNPDSKDMAILYISDVISMMTGLGGGADGIPKEWNVKATELIGFKQADMQIVMAELVIQMEKADSMLALVN